MRKTAFRGVLRSRQAKAVVVVCAIVLAVPIGNAFVLLSKAPALDGEQFANQGICSAALLDAADAFSSLDRVEALAQEAGGPLPSSYSQEVGLLEGARDIRVSGRGDVVGYLVAGECAGVLADMSRHMELRGWTTVPLGDVQGATFVKTQGECTWILVSCTQVGEMTSVVTRSATT